MLCFCFAVSKEWLGHLPDLKKPGAGLQGVQDVIRGVGGVVVGLGRALGVVGAPLDVGGGLGGLSGL